jgi:hypothetical protein
MPRVLKFFACLCSSKIPELLTYRGRTAYGFPIKPSLRGIMLSVRFWQGAATVRNSLLWCATVGVLILNIVLLRQNRILRTRLDSSTGATVTAGQQMHDLAGVSLNGYLRPIALPASPSERLLIIGFSPNCGYCRANQNRWQVLARGVNERKGWRVVWVSRDPITLTADYCRTQSIANQDVVAEPPEATYDQLGLRIVPRTIVVGPGGIVEKVWSGQLGPNQWNEVFSFLKLSDNMVSNSPSGTGTLEPVGPRSAAK